LLSPPLPNATHAVKDVQEVLQRMTLDRGNTVGILNSGLASELEHYAEDRLNDHEDEQNKAGSLM
jgi:hypothetical protein